MITPESIERVREAADIVEIVGEHVKLKRSGSSWRGPCPFHHGSGPNFSVTPRTNAYYCFVCHAKGDVIGFVRDHLGLDFVEAVKYVADRAGVEVQETRSARPEERDAREPLWEANAAAAELFRTTLWEDPEAEAARAYLASRDIGREDADRFGFGYAWRDGARWVDRLKVLGHDEARLLEAGLLGRRADSDEVYPYFRGRLMLPIQDAAGRTVAFGGRALRDDQQPKYLNSPQGALFDKGRQLYGLSWAKHPIRKAERALVVEGYFDAIRVALAGVDEVVAGLGTALTEDQAGLVAKLTRNVFLVYDGDTPGQKATVKAGWALLRQGVAPRVVSLPGEDDPDTYVRAHGRDALEAALAQGLDLFDWQLLLTERKGYFATLHRARRAIDKLLPTVRAASDPLTRELYLGKLAAVSGVDREVLQREADAPRGRGSANMGATAVPMVRPDAPVQQAPVAPTNGLMSAAANQGRPAREISADGVEYVLEPPVRDARPPFRPFERRGSRGRRFDEWLTVRARPRVPQNARTHSAERALIRAMVQDRALVEVVAERWPPDAFHEIAFRELFARLVDDPHQPLDDAVQGFPDAAVGEIDRAVAERDPTPEVTVAGRLQALHVWELERELAEISQRLRAPSSALDPGAELVQNARRDAIRTELAALSTVFRGVNWSMGPRDDVPADDRPGPPGRG